MRFRQQEKAMNRRMRLSLAFCAAPIGESGVQQQQQQQGSFAGSQAACLKGRGYSVK